MIGLILHREEYERLKPVGMPDLSLAMRPEDLGVAIVEHDGEIVATMSVIRVTHFESLWIDPRFRGNPKLVKELVSAGVLQAKSFGSKWVWGASDTEHMSDIIRRVGGTEVPVRSFVIPVGD